MCIVFVKKVCVFFVFTKGFNVYYLESSKLLLDLAAMYM